MPRLLVYKFTLIYAIQVFLRSNPNASRNRSLLFPGSGLLSLRPHIVLAPLTNGSRLCMMTYIQYCQRLLSVSQYASLLVLAGKVVSFTNCVGNISRFMTKSLFFLPPPRVCLFVTRELKQSRRRRQQKPHKFAYLTMKNSIFARFARAFFIF